MEQQQKLVHIQAMIQLTEYIDSLIKQNSGFSSEQLKQQPLPEVQEQNLSLQKIQKRLQRVLGTADTTFSEVPTTKEIVSSVYVKVEPEVQKPPPMESKKAEKCDGAAQSKMTESQRELYYLMRKLMLKVGTQEKSNWFLGHLCNEAIPSYDVHIVYSMCYQAILTRFVCSVEAGVELEICNQQHRNILVNVQKADYGSFAEFAVRNLKHVARNQEMFFKDPYTLGVKTYQSLKNKPRPYKAVSEIVRDFILVFTNCWYFNYQNDAFRKIASDGLRDLYTLFVQHYSEQVWPQWAQWLFTQPRELEEESTMLAKIKQLREWQIMSKDHEFNPDLDLKIQATAPIQKAQVQPTAQQQEQPVVQQQTKQQVQDQKQLKAELVNFVNQYIEDDQFVEKIVDVTGGDDPENLDINTLLEIKEMIQQALQ